ncbi:MAG: transposase [Rickettsiales bacterium]|nr:transposase [Rickettsiales bacterium]
MVAPQRVNEGDKVELNGNHYTVHKIIDLATVMLKSEKNSKTEIVALKALFNEEDDEEELFDLGEISEELWSNAEDRYRAIEPLLGLRKRTFDDVKKQAKEANVHPSSIYRWLEIYESTEKLSSLVMFGTDGGKGKTRLPEEIDAMLDYVIEEYYLKKQKRKISKVYSQLELLCHRANIKCPHINTLRNRINLIDEKKRVEKRLGRQARKQQFGLDKGKNNDGKHPLSVVQIDHTPMDIIIVEEQSRKPIGKPWITLAIDTYSRMVAGFYIAMEEPSSLSVGMCLSNAILPKESLLAKYNINAEWPVWGFMSSIHADNAKEFRGKMLQKACQEYGINLLWRPVGKANYGGHIERVLGTFNDEVHTLPGTTFSNIQERGRYNSSKEALLTLNELEKWLITFICEIYHQRLHSGINMSPLDKYKKGILGDKKKPGIGLPYPVKDPDKLKLDFLPLYERSIQSYGIMIDKIRYSSDYLKTWVGARDKTNAKRKFLIRRDPRDISKIFFFDPEIKQYFEIPYEKIDAPPMSIWEYRHIRRKLRDEGKKNVDQELIFEAYEKLNNIVVQAKEEKKKVKRKKVTKKFNTNAAKDKYETKQTELEDWGEVIPYEELDSYG